MIWRMKRLKKLKTLIFSMIKVGCMGFGGGNALIPVIEEEAVKDKKLVSCQEYDRTILAATLTPGALPVELAAGDRLRILWKERNGSGKCCHGTAGSTAYYTVTYADGTGRSPVYWNRSSMHRWESRL